MYKAIQSVCDVPPDNHEAQRYKRPRVSLLQRKTDSPVNGEEQSLADVFPLSKSTGCPLLPSYSWSCDRFSEKKYVFQKERIETMVQIVLQVIQWAYLRKDTFGNLFVVAQNLFQCISTELHACLQVQILTEGEATQVITLHYIAQFQVFPLCIAPRTNR